VITYHCRPDPRYGARDSARGAENRPPGSRIPHPASRRTRFTLIELLAAIAVIAILMGLLLQGVNLAKRKSHLSVCASQLRQIGMAVHMYANTYEDYLPDAARLGPDPITARDSMKNLLVGELTEDAVYHCPADTEPDSLFAAVGTSYEWNTFVSGKRIDRSTFTILDIEMKPPIVGDGDPFHEKIGRNYLYPDGHVSQNFEVLIDAN
jgi:prepilin-type N-terminal cleavage/methylation domain-containing protein/prepilin-type processing-associated H-X9-DG protein